MQIEEVGKRYGIYSRHLPQPEMHTPEKRTSEEAELSTPTSLPKRMRYETPTRSALNKMVVEDSPAVTVSYLRVYIRTLAFQLNFINQVLVKGKRKSRAHFVHKSSGLKKLVRGVANRSNRTIARQALLNNRVRPHLFTLLKKQIQKELTRMCSKKQPSLLRSSSPDSIASFSWESIANEVFLVAPTFHTILQACVNVKRRKRANTSGGKRHKTYHRSDNAALGVCACILLRHRNHHLNLFQRLVSLILHSGHSGKQVYTPMHDHYCIL